MICKEEQNDWQQAVETTIWTGHDWQMTVTIYYYAKKKKKKKKKTTGTPLLMHLHLFVYLPILFMYTR